MRQTGKWIAVLAVVLMAAGQAQAVVTGATGIDFGNGSFGGIGGIGSDSLTLSKSYTSIGEMFLDIRTDGPGVILIQEDIGNDTGIDWADFHWDLAAEVGVDLTFISVDTGGAFGNISFNVDMTEAWADGGPGVPDGGVFSAILMVNVGADIGQTWGIGQIPSINAVPEPISAAMGMVGLAILGYTTRRRAV